MTAAIHPVILMWRWALNGTIISPQYLAPFVKQSPFHTMNDMSTDRMHFC